MAGRLGAQPPAAVGRASPLVAQWVRSTGATGCRDRYLFGPGPSQFPFLCPAETVRAIKASALLIIGDSDIVRPERAVEMLRLLGGGVKRDGAGVPNSHLAVLSGTTPVVIMHRPDLVLAILPAFLDATTPRPISQDSKS